MRSSYTPDSSSFAASKLCCTTGTADAAKLLFHEVAVCQRTDEYANQRALILVKRSFGSGAWIYVSSKRWSRNDMASSMKIHCAMTLLLMEELLECMAVCRDSSPHMEQGVDERNLWLASY